MKTEMERTVEYSNSALGFLRKAEIPPYPQFYEMFYTYATGVNPALNKRINDMFRNDADQLSEAAESLYDEFLRSTSIDERMSAVSEKISENIQSVHSAITSASNSAETYSGSLEEAQNLFEDLTDPAELKTLAQSLLAQTRDMQAVNKSLEEKLESSKDDIDILRSDLLEVQRENMTDALTKIPNRKCFDLEMQRAIDSATESGDPLCLVMTDIDHFKKFNDTYGHQTGDQVLRLVAITLQSNTADSDIAARYGGEEFGIIMPNTGIEIAVKAMERIRKAIQAKELLRKSTNEKLGRVTSSFGIAQFKNGDTYPTLLERADRALYAAKENGRNRVMTEFDKDASIGQSAA